MADLHGWQADPFGIHDQRYFSQGQPTKLVRDQGVESYDPPPAIDPLNPQAALSPATAQLAFTNQPGETNRGASGFEQPSVPDRPSSAEEETARQTEGWKASNGNGYWSAAAGRSGSSLPQLSPQVRLPPADTPPEPGWWLASDGHWYPPDPESAGSAISAPTPPTAPPPIPPPRPGWWLASDGNWYPPDADQSTELVALAGWREVGAETRSWLAPSDVFPQPRQGQPAPGSEQAVGDEAPVLSAPSPQPGWWLASDGNWYPPELAESAQPTDAAELSQPSSPPQPGWWLASDGNWYPPDLAEPSEVAESAQPTDAAELSQPSSSPQPGWWLASDGNWYPPELAASDEQ